MITSFLLLLAAQPAAEPLPSVLHVFADWTAACDNGRSCQASSLMPEGADIDKQRILTVERGPAPDAEFSLVLPSFDGRPARVMIGDQAAEVTIAPSGENEFRIVPRDRNAFLDQAGYADKLIVQDAAGTSIGEASLKGLHEALLYIDEVQGRIDTVTALVERGRRPASAVPPAPAVPVVRLAGPTQERPIAIPAARLTRLRTDAGCADLGPPGAPVTNQTFALGGGKTLLLLSCGAGAYNMSSAPYLVTRQGSQLSIVAAPFDVQVGFGGDDPGGPPLMTNPGWDPSGMVLTEYVKGRGLGDCGAHSDYGWDGTSFRLILRQEMGECRGSISYLTTWRAEVRH
jgi:hypothetical protein